MRKIGRTGFIVVVTGPSGVGKTSTCVGLESERFWRRLVTITTRPPRPGEIPGYDYHFLTNEQFDQAEAAGLIGEKTVYVGSQTRYGIFQHDIESALYAPLSYVILDAYGRSEIQRIWGAHNMADRVFSVFMAAPKEVLAQRIRHRMESKGEPEPLIQETIAKRLSSYEIEMASNQGYDYTLQAGTKTLPEVMAEMRRIVNQFIQPRPFWFFFAELFGTRRAA